MFSDTQRMLIALPQANVMKTFSWVRKLTMLMFIVIISLKTYLTDRLMYVLKLTELESITIRCDILLTECACKNEVIVVKYVY